MTSKEARILKSGRIYNLTIDSVVLEKIVRWAQELESPTPRLGSVIMGMESEIACLKYHHKMLKDIKTNLNVKHELDLDCINDVMSVRCDGKMVSINIFTVNHEQRVQLKKLGFSWSKTKLEFVRKVSGINVDVVREFIGGNV